MLCLNMNQGEYITIGDNVVVQMYGIEGDRCRVMIEAPREVAVLRGKVRERNGEQRPSCVFDGPRWHRKELAWTQNKAQALAAMRTLLSQMDGKDKNVRALRGQLNQMFPPVPREETEQSEVSNG